MTSKGTVSQLLTYSRGQTKVQIKFTWRSKAFQHIWNQKVAPWNSSIGCMANQGIVHWKGYLEMNNDKLLRTPCITASSGRFGHVFANRRCYQSSFGKVFSSGAKGDFKIWQPSWCRIVCAVLKPHSLKKLSRNIWSQSEGHKHSDTQSGELLLCLTDLNGFDSFLDWHSDWVGSSAAFNRKHHQKPMNWRSCV